MRIIPFMRIVLFLICASVGLAACQPAPTAPDPVRAELTAPVSRVWPDADLTLMSRAEPHGTVWLAWGNNTVTVPAAWANLQEHPATDPRWSATINTLRSRAARAPWVISHNPADAPLQALVVDASPPLSPAPMWAWPSFVPPDNTVQVFVAPNCTMCLHWKDNWPSSIPVQWVPTWPFAPEHSASLASESWLDIWCPPHQPHPVCMDTLRAQHKRAQALGVLMAPAALAADGRLLTGWPDQVWLGQWWDPTSPLAHAEPVRVDEPDL